MENYVINTDRRETTRKTKNGFIRIVSDVSDRTRDWRLVKKFADGKISIYSVAVMVKAEIYKNNLPPQIENSEVHLSPRAWRWGSGGISAIAPTENEARLLIGQLEETDAAPIP